MAMSRSIINHQRQSTEKSCGGDSAAKPADVYRSIL
jgi:hypothetical protein